MSNVLVPIKEYNDLVKAVNELIAPSIGLADMAGIYASSRKANDVRLSTVFAEYSRKCSTVRSIFKTVNAISKVQ